VLKGERGNCYRQASDTKDFVILNRAYSNCDLALMLRNSAWIVFRSKLGLSFTFIRQRARSRNTRSIVLAGCLLITISSYSRTSRSKKAALTIGFLHHIVFLRGVSIRLPPVAHFQTCAGRVEAETSDVWPKPQHLPHW